MAGRNQGGLGVATRNRTITAQLPAYLRSVAGGGVKPGTSYGETDDFSYNIVKDPMHIRDLNATILNLLGMDHERLTFVQPHAFHWVRKPLETD